MMMILMKVSDISNEARPLDVAAPWVDCLLQEFFNQVWPSFAASHWPMQDNSFPSNTRKCFVFGVWGWFVVYDFRFLCKVLKCAHYIDIFIIFIFGLILLRWVNYANLIIIYDNCVFLIFLNLLFLTEVLLTLIFNFKFFLLLLLLFFLFFFFLLQILLSFVWDFKV